ncbi:MAG: glucokinase [Elusimicrobiota bacterium]
MPEPLILAGDVGGTNTRLAVFSSIKAKPEAAERLEIFPSRDFKNLSDAVEKFIAEREVSVAAACFGVAGPVKDGRVEATNLPWNVDSRDLSRALGGAPVVLLNDLEANAWGLAALGPEDFEVLNAGDFDVAGNQGLIAAGTGLGEALLVWNGIGRVISASEGGHADFAPRSEIEIELFQFLMKEFGRVSYERVVSGPGLFNIYRFLRQKCGGRESDRLLEGLRSDDPAAAISRSAASGEDEVCARAVDIMVSIYGAEAGNLALKIMARGGIFIGGGIAPKLLSKLKEPAFMAAFSDKGRMSRVLKSIPVRVILNDKAALLGAASRALAIAPH